MKDLGFYGTGTVSMNFTLAQFPQYTCSQNELQLAVVIDAQEDSSATHIT